MNTSSIRVKYGDESNCCYVSTQTFGIRVPIIYQSCNMLGQTFKLISLNTMSLLKVLKNTTAYQQPVYRVSWSSRTRNVWPVVKTSPRLNGSSTIYTIACVCETMFTHFINQ